MKISRKAKHRILTTLAVVGVLAVIGGLTYRWLMGSVLRELTDGRLEAADYWGDEPRILSGGMGFDNIIGLPTLDGPTVRDAGGSWYGGLSCTSGAEPGTDLRTSAAVAGTIGQAFEGYADYDDGLPIVFSWPVATETVDPTDFRFTLNTGETVFPHAAGMNPNWELNERNTVVVFGDFGNRSRSAEADSRFPVRLDIVEDETPLLMIGPDGEAFDAVGQSWTTETSPYDSGPSLVGAKLNAIEGAPAGEGGVMLMEQADNFPNDEATLYDEGDFRLRVLTTGGFSPDGVTGLRPDMFEDFFRLHAIGPDGEPILLERTGTDYEVEGGTLRIIGLSDLGRVEDHANGVYYDDCYAEDGDNYIDIILVGDEAAARSVTDVEIPSLDRGYRAFYNPGGPGPEPTEGVTYTAPGPRDLEPVVLALDDPMRVSRASQVTSIPWALIGAVTASIVGGAWLLVRRHRRKRAG